MASSTSYAPLSVAVIAFEGISPFHLAAPCVVFGEAHPGMPRIDFKVCAQVPGLLKTPNGFDIRVAHGLEALKGADIVIVPSWPAPDLAAPAAVLEALQKAHAGGSLMLGLCLGTFVLAQAGLLDGRQATTHWAHAQDLQRLHPSVELTSDVLYVEDERVLTSAGTAAALDCCLHLLGQRLGHGVAARVGERLVSAPHRIGSQVQRLELPLPATSRQERVSALLGVLQFRLAEAHSLESCAAAVHMSRRTFTRQFRQITGLSLGDWLLQNRLQRARQLLSESDLGLDAIAAKVGLGSSVSMRKHFKQHTGMTPQHWRSQQRIRAGIMSQ